MLNFVARELRLSLALLVSLSATLGAQPVDRLNGPIASSRRVLLAGSRNPRVDKLADGGPVDGAERIEGLGMRFKPTARQSAELEQLLAEQQNPASPRYHSWLSPEEFADRFGMSDSDYRRVSEWLESQGFHVDGGARSRTWITFSGTADRVRRAFGADVHRFTVNGRSHVASVTETLVPADLERLIYPVRGLDNLPDEPHGRTQPKLKLSDGTNAIGPGDLAAIYNMNPLLEKGYTGAGQRIVVAGKSSLKLSDVRAFRDLFGLPQNDPKVVLVPGYADPEANDEFYEVTADVELAGAIAPNASITFVYAPSAYTAAEYAIDQNLAPVISFSFSGCEKHAGSQQALVAATRAIAQQANAQGITWVAIAGDTGIAGCESQKSDYAGVSGASVNLPASFPEVTGVGGTMFVEGAGNYWASDRKKGAPTALSYIPEAAWNETAGGLLAASGGGASSFFSRPPWQSGPGLPEGTARMVPDISLAAAWDHDPYVILADGDVWSWGGTSSSTPVFAGMLAIVNQYLVATGAQSKPGLGNVNPRLYQIARTVPGVFHDIVSGDNIVPCKTGTPDCTTGRYGSAATPGWDAATGLGSLDLNNLATRWAGGDSTTGLTPIAVTVTANPSTIAAGGSTVVTAVVKPDRGTAAPSGSIYFSAGEKDLGTVEVAPANGVASATITVRASDLITGANTVVAYYGGSSTFLPSTGASTVIVSGKTSSVNASAIPSPVYKQLDADGYAWHFSLVLKETAGVSTTITGFSVDGEDRSERIPQFFSATFLPANGTLVASPRVIQGGPAEHVFGFAGVDADGQRWTRQLTVSFLNEETPAAMSLASAAEVVRAGAKADPRCTATRPIYQELILQELNGGGIRLTKFVAGPDDWSDQIQLWFGSLRLAPYGKLTARICWDSSGLPTTRNFIVEGVDSGGRTVQAKLQVAFKTAALIPGALAVSRSSVQLPTASGSDIDTLNVTLPGDEAWSASVFPANPRSSWLTVSPASGRGPAHLTLNASSATLPSGAYTATLIIQSEYMTPQFVEVPVLFLVGVSAARTITGAQNAASFKPVFAPGMLMSVYGTNLANSTQSAKSMPLPRSIDGVTASVNGVPAPLWFVSPGQMNLQIPYETALGAALVVVNNNGQLSGGTVEVTSAAPGIFNTRGALIPLSSAVRGGEVSIYLTGEGELSPMVESGAPPPESTPAAQLPKPRGAVRVTVGGVPAEVTFVGNPWLVGVTQLNFRLAANTPTGQQPVVVTVDGLSSAAATLTVL